MTQISEIVWRQGVYIYLRPITEKDIPSFQKWINDQNNSHFLTVGQPIGMVAEEEWYKSVAGSNPDNITVAICLNDGTLIGNISIRINSQKQSAITGTLIGPHEHKGKGYATEAKILILDYAFNWRNVRKVTSKILAFNERSQKYAQRCGYRFMARIEQEHFRNGKWIDELQFVVFRDEWRPFWDEYQKTL